MIDFPPDLPHVDLVAPVPRRIRAVVGGRTVLDTVSALYLYEWTHYPQYYIPAEDIDPASLVDEQHVQTLRRGTARRYGLSVGDDLRPGALRIYDADNEFGIGGHARVEWDAVDAWFEEDEQVFVHPRDPYTRVDALRSTRRIRVEIGGVVLAESDSPVLVFETGLPTRYYLNPTEVDVRYLHPTDTETACPYKGVTSTYWDAHVGDRVIPDIAWRYDHPGAGVLPISGLIAFHNEVVDITLDGRHLERPATHLR